MRSSRKKRSRRVALAAVIGGVVAVAGAVWSLRHEFVIDWYRRPAAEELRAMWNAYSTERSSTPVAGPAVRRLLDLDVGDRVLGQLLCDPDPEVWKPLCSWLNWDVEDQRVARLRRHLARTRGLALLRIQLHRSMLACGSREAIDHDAGAGTDWIDRWTGGAPAPVPASNAAVALCSSFLRLPDGERGGSPVCHFRAVDGLALMVPRATSKTELLAQAARDGPAGEALRLLLETARGLSDGELRLRPDYPGLRLHALNRLEYLASRTASPQLPDLWHWEWYSRVGPEIYDDAFDMPSVRYDDPAAFDALLHVDDPRVTLVVARLVRQERYRRALTEFEASEVSLVSRPSWLPLAERCREHLRGDLKTRTRAVCALAALGDPDGAPILREALRREADESVRRPATPEARRAGSRVAARLYGRRRTPTRVAGSRRDSSAAQSTYAALAGPPGRASNGTKSRFV